MTLARFISIGILVVFALAVGIATFGPTMAEDAPAKPVTPAPTQHLQSPPKPTGGASDPSHGAAIFDPTTGQAVPAEKGSMDSDQNKQP